MPSKKSIKTHQGFLRKLIRDDRLQPSRRLLAEMLLLHIEGLIPYELLESIYGNTKVQWNDRTSGDKEFQENTQLVKQAQSALKDIYAEFGGDNDSADNETGS